MITCLAMLVAHAQFMRPEQHLEQFDINEVYDDESGQRLPGLAAPGRGA